MNDEQKPTKKREAVTAIIDRKSIGSDANVLDMTIASLEVIGGSRRGEHFLITEPI